jgi:transketolase
MSLSASILSDKARALRFSCIQMAHEAREGHLNGALSCLDVLLVLFNNWLVIHPEDERHPDRDRFIFSKGHACSGLYVVMADRGLIPRKLLAQYGRTDSPLPNHHCIHALPRLEWSAGSLGHGLGVASGVALALNRNGSKARSVALLSDGECNEGSTWEAAMFARAQKLDNLVAIVDYNRVQSIDYTDNLTGNTGFEEKFRAFGWHAVTIDGHDFSAIEDALNQAPLHQGVPCAIIAKTVAGKGVSFMENQVLWHYRTPSVEDVDRAKAELQAEAIY